LSKKCVMILSLLFLIGCLAAGCTINDLRTNSVTPDSDIPPENLPPSTLPQEQPPLDPIAQELASYLKSGIVPAPQNENCIFEVKEGICEPPLYVMKVSFKQSINYGLEKEAWQIEYVLLKEDDGIKLLHQATTTLTPEDSVACQMIEREFTSCTVDSPDKVTIESTNSKFRLDRVEYIEKVDGEWTKQ